MNKSSLRTAAAAAALATGLAAGAATPAQAAAPERITTQQQLMRSLESAIAQEAARGTATVTDDNVVGYVAPRADTATKPC
ncbi:hypothetical protein ACFPM3_28380 [Streptomyces coeruleoprunus]|uniref:Uncharacterized protein n=1 Tax=Streptomyces coeruleoprunus TaxID=285563 RepID=A0ABV9XP97_9ACTN